MSKWRLTLIMTVVFVLTMGIFFYFRLTNLFQKQIVAEMGPRSTPGFTETLIADSRLIAKGTQPVQGNQQLAFETGKEFLEEVLATAGAYREMPADEDPLGLPLPRVYCLVRGEFVVFLAYIPTIGDWPKEQQQKLALELWPTAQALAADVIDGYPTVGLALRGHRLYGPIFIGGKQAEPLHTQTGGRYVLYPYFLNEPALQPQAPAGPETAKNEPAPMAP